VWLVSELYYPEETSTGHFLTGIAEGLAGRYRVRVLSAQPTYAHRGERAAARERRHGVEIRRCWGTALDKDVLAFRMLNLATISVSIFVRALLVFRRRDCAIVVTNPPLLPFLVALACRWKGARCILLIHDVYPEVLVAAGLAPRRLQRLLARATRWLYRSVDRIVVLGRDMETLVASRLGRDRPPIVLIPNWADADEVRPAPRGECRLLGELGLIDRFVVQYSGNMGRTHGLEAVLGAAESLLGSDSIHFLLIGWGAKKRWVDRAVQERSLTNVTVLSPRPRSELADALNACDLALISLVAGTAGVSVPSRMYNVMAAGKPILAAAEEGSELARVVAEERVGWVVPPGDAAALAAALERARQCPQSLREMGERARRAAEGKYTLERVVGAYHSLIEGLSTERDECVC
jgi:glycosyltransferase involved in cell wall biosynthesis